MSDDSRNGGEGDGHINLGSHRSTAQALSDRCARIRQLQAERRFCIGQQSRLNNALGAFARWQLGWHVDLPEKERDAIRTKATKLISLLRKGKEVPDDMAEAASVVAPFLKDTAAGLAPFGQRRKDIEQTMRRLVADTPGAEFTASVRGLGDLGLAVIIGEAGDLSDYPSVAKLWKRLGWAPREEYPKGVRSEGRKVPRRVKGELYGAVLEPLMKHNGDGKYKSLYDARKAAYLERFEREGGKTPKLHAHKLAMRVMLKELLKDLWRTWNGQFCCDAQWSAALPPSADPVAGFDPINTLMRREGINFPEAVERLAKLKGLSP